MEMKGLARGQPLLPDREPEKFAQIRLVSSDQCAHTSTDTHSWHRMTSLITCARAPVWSAKVGRLGLRVEGLQLPLTRD